MKPEVRLTPKKEFIPEVGSLKKENQSWLLSHCISLCTLFAERVVGKMWAGKLEENCRSCRKCRHVCSLLAGTAAAAADTLYSLLSWLIQQHNHRQSHGAIRRPQGLLRWCFYRHITQSSPWPSEYLVTCCKLSQLLHSHVFTKCGAREPDHHLG